MKMKISVGFRDFSTGRAIALIRSYISTIRKNRVNVIDGLIVAFENVPWFPEIKFELVFEPLTTTFGVSTT